MTLVKFKVSQTTLNQTDKCRNDYSCLSGKKECLCSVTDSFDGKVLFVKPLCSNECGYKMSFGYSYVCNCPIRKEIYNKYNH